MKSRLEVRMQQMMSQANIHDCRRECNEARSTYPAPRASVLEIIMLFAVVISFVFVIL